MMDIIKAIPLFSGIFFAGYQVNRIDSLFTKINTAEQEVAGTKEIILDIHGRVCRIEQQMKDHFIK